MLLVLTIYLQRKHEDDETGNDAVYLGALAPGTQSSLIPDVCRKRVPNDAAILSLGMTTGVVLNELTKGAALKSGASFIDFHKRGNKMFLNLVLLDGSGETLVIIKDNHFMVNSNKILRDLVPDDHSLLVFDLQNRLILHIEFRNPLNIYVRGTFSSPQRLPITIRDDVILLGGWKLSESCFTDIKVPAISN